MNESPSINKPLLLIAKLLAFSGFGLMVADAFFARPGTSGLTVMGWVLIIVGIITYGRATAEFRRHYKNNAEAAQMKIPESEVQSFIGLGLGMAIILCITGLTLIFHPLSIERTLSITDIGLGILFALAFPLIYLYIPRLRKVSPAQLYRRDEREHHGLERAAGNAFVTTSIALLLIPFTHLDRLPAAQHNILAVIFLVGAVGFGTYFTSLLRYRR